MYKKNIWDFNLLPADWFEKQIYQSSQVIKFGMEDGQYEALANVTSGFPIKIGPYEFQTSEGLYQACGFGQFPNIQFQLARQKHGSGAKIIKEKFMADRRPDWQEIKFMMMQLCLEQKIFQYWQILSPLLIKTKDKPLVEVSLDDSRWGSILDSKTGQLEGCNWMGRTWEIIRRRLSKLASFQAWSDHSRSNQLLDYLEGKK